DGLKVTAVVDGATRSATATLKYTADTASAKVDTVTMTSDHTVFLADGNDSAEYTAAVTDQYGNPVANTAVTWTTTGGTLANAQTTTDPQGNTSGTLTDTQAETVTVSAAAGTSQPTAADKTVEFRTATLQDNTPDATEKPVGDGPGSTFTFTASVMDNTGAPVKDAEIKWRQDGGTDYRLSADTVRTDDQGRAQVTLTDPMHKATDRITVTATYNGRSVGADVAYLADATTAAVSALTLADPTVTTRAADGTDAFTWNALVTDQYGNKVNKAAVTWSTDTAGTPPAQTTSQTGNTGEASTTLVSATAVSNVHMQAKTAVQQTAYTSPVGVSFVVQGAATITGAVTTDNSVADGATADVVTITVTDPAGNPVTGVDLTADLSKSNGVQTTDGNTRWALDAAGKATISFTTTVAGTHSIVFSVPGSANANAGAGTVNITFVAGPVDAAQSEVTVPVGAAVQGDPLELHLYARDANRNPVTAAQLDKVNVAIAATGTGITLTANPLGDDTDATGPYRKYSLVPDTASYATQAIRYNTVTVQVNGTRIGTEFHAAWSPDINLDNGWPTAYTYSEAREVISACPTLFVVDTSATVYTGEGYAGGPLNELCGRDTATALAVRVTKTRTTPITDATASFRGNSRRTSTWISADSEIVKADCDGCQQAREVKITDTNTMTVTGGVTLPNGAVLSRRPIKVTYPSSIADPTNPLAVSITLGVLDNNDAGKRSQLFERTYGEGQRTLGPGLAPLTFYSEFTHTYAVVHFDQHNAWFDRFTLSNYRYTVVSSTCTNVFGEATLTGANAKLRGWFAVEMSGVRDYRYAVPQVVVDMFRGYAVSNEGAGLYALTPSVDSEDMANRHELCTGTDFDTGYLSEKDQNIVAPHYLKYSRY
ncbi:Ig-like domain-containing protein, partial [Salmonella enterica subsp. enterica serovar Minnesota]|uniref:Ig-like domain-containing protein n=1 Tax=Salmonella enterica TaxID=28901 RepID=UPI0021B3FE4A